MPARCVVFGCHNNSDKKDRLVVMPHVQTLSFHGCHDVKMYRSWNKLINRKDKAWKGVNRYTKVCSNHFKLGQPLPDSPNPVLYMKGYGVLSKNSRPSPRERHNDTSKTRKRDHSHGDSDRHHEGNSMAETTLDVEELVKASSYSPSLEHGYSCPRREVCDTGTPIVDDLIHTITNMQQHIDELEKSLQSLTRTDASPLTHSDAPSLTLSVPAASPSDSPLICSFASSSMQPDTHSAAPSASRSDQHPGPRISMQDIKHDDDLIRLHTGIINYATFEWLLDEVKPAASSMQYYKGSSSHEAKQYQLNNTRRPGKERRLSIHDELMLTLMRIKLDLLEEYLAFLFCVTPSTVSQILSTWIPLLSRELSGLIYWPSQEHIRQAYPECFKKFDTVRAIIDCTEVGIQRPSLASANSQIFSSYKNKPTAKFLLACTPAGTISFLSDAAGGRMSDKELTASSGICDLFQLGDVCMADRGFTIQDLLLPHGARLVMPPFTKKGKQFTTKAATDTKTIANARIHVERVINRWKDFRILQGTVPLSMVDLLGDIGKICAALVNLLPSVIPPNYDS